MSEAVAEKRTALDVSRLPTTLFDGHSALWWGNALLLAIETAMFGILIAIYFSVLMQTEPFPPPRVERLPVLYGSYPDLLLPVIGLIVLLASVVPAIMLDKAARDRNAGLIRILLPITLLFNVAAIVIRWYEYDSLHFKWADNAYGSITWMILGMHMFHLFVMFCEDAFLLVWTYIKGVDDKHALDLTVLAVYWYWVVGVWFVLFSIVYLVPRLTL
jgi:heme/copper-type cytochrome/quinol oxidase subunit 3